MLVADYYCDASCGGFVLKREAAAAAIESIS
jgi:hypothetical protein